MSEGTSKSVFITGVSSGIGKSLALHYARDGVTLGLTARREGLLQEVRQACEARGATVHAYAVDVADTKAMAKCAEAFIKDTGGVDLVIANAAITVEGQKRHVYYDAEKLNGLIQVNLCGVINTVTPFLKHAVETRHPTHFAAVGSVAGFRGLPGGSYGASKAGVKTMMDTWRLIFRGTGMHFTTICPGYVKSEMTDRDAFAPSSRLSSEKAAVLIAKALQRKRKTFVFPFWYVPVVLALPWIPDVFFWLGTHRGMED